MNGPGTKAESEDLWSRYDLEYRAYEDDAWYDVYVVLDATAEKLTVKYWSSPAYEIVFTAVEFATEAQVDDLAGRFRPVSVKLEDNECWMLSIGTTVCAAHAIGDDLYRFYDAVIEAVKRQAHSFADGEEKCLCNFVLFWKNGRGRGTLTSANIARICITEPATQLDPRISAFTIMAKKKITSSDSIFTRKKDSELSQNRSLEMDTIMTQKSLMLESEAGSGKMCNYNAWPSQDEDLGSSCYTEFILICNLENDLTPSSIKDFIYKQTSILPQAFVFPRPLSDPFARGAIMVDSQKKVQIIYEFLENPNHIVVSSRGRPWVIAEKASVWTFGANIWNLIPMTLDEIKCIRIDARRIDEELQVVISGTESYNRAKQLKDLLVEYIHHESQLCKRLVLEEQKIWQSCQPA
ncbi:hypothetical protein ACS0TY_010645 [Phlomoides rotata]